MIKNTLKNSVMSDFITESGNGLSILICSTYNYFNNWMAFSNWYSIRKNLPELRKDARCTRCSGRGYLDDNEKWIQYRGDPVNRVGFKGCFKCKGSGIEPKMEPVFFRRRVVDHIINKLEDGKINQVKQWASMVQNSTLENQPYKPLLMDIVELIDKLNDINILKSEIDKLPH